MAKTNETNNGGGGASTAAETASETFNCPLNVAVNDAVYLYGTHEVRKADATALSTAPAIGIVKEKPTTTTCVVVTDGEFDFLAGSLTPGAVYYLAKGTPGAITNTPISGPGVSQKLGVARSATVLVLNIDSDFVELI